MRKLKETKIYVTVENFFSRLSLNDKEDSQKYNPNSYFFRGILAFRKKFSTSIFYYDELRRRTSVVFFLSKHKIISTLLFFGIPLALFMCFKISLSQFEEAEKYTLTLFDFASPLATYFGSTLLGFFVYYNTWYQKQKDNIRKQIVLDVESLPNVESECGWHSVYTSKQAFDLLGWHWDEEHAGVHKNSIKIKLDFTNKNQYCPLKIKFIAAYYQKHGNNEMVKKIDNVCLLHSEGSQLLKYCETNTWFLSIGKSIFDEKANYQYYVMFHVYNNEGESSYLVYSNELKEASCFSTSLVTSEFKKLIKKHGLNVFYDLDKSRKYNNKWIRKIELYKR